MVAVGEEEAAAVEDQPEITEMAKSRVKTAKDKEEVAGVEEEEAEAAIVLGETTTATTLPQTDKLRRPVPMNQEPQWPPARLECWVPT